ncbi:type VI secretion system lipoprotein TssJ [Pantoea sp. NPDC088449]|uniref:type VI secretion system lipoprotein TssJ n=1 Tax=Pantoea sp. NPDC088449 TaxID=3364392 RepID=UPI0037F1EA39
MITKIMHHAAASHRRWLTMLIILSMTSMLTSCQSTPNNDSSAHTESVKITFDASNTINKNDAGEANPLRITVYQLNQQQAFMASDFITLTESRDPELTSQISLIYDTMIVPGEKKDKVIETPKNVTALGVITAYRDISDSEWKVIYIIPEKPKRSWFQRYFKRDKVWQPHIQVRMNNLTTSVKPVN